LDGLDRLNDRGYFIQPPSGAAAIRQLEDLSSPVGAFLRDRCVRDSEATVPVDDLWTAWKTWCEDQNLPKRSKETFGRDLRAAVPELDKSRPREGEDRIHIYTGIGLVQETLPGHGDRRDRVRSGHGGHGDRPMYGRDEPERDEEAALSRVKEMLGATEVDR
jgi:hypothetical protein